MAISDKDFERITDLFFMMLNQARDNRELYKSAMRDVRDGTYTQEKQRAKRKPSAYNKRYAKAFKKLASKYKTKSGKWKKDGFKRCSAAARKEAKR